MDNEKVEVVENEILMSGVDDWVDVPLVLYAARRALGGASEAEALPLAVQAIKSLLSRDLIEIGEAMSRFEPWVGSYGALARRIDKEMENATFPILVSEPFWINVKPAGCEKGKLLLASSSDLDE